jgi:V8-like Glu-specific endopeptidase
MEQIENGICKIKGKNIQGTGFFCKIMNGNKDEYVLITNNHVIDESILNRSKELRVELLNGEKKIELNKNKKLYTSKVYDITIIEINKEKENIDYFLELDEIALKENPQIYSENVYIIQYPGTNFKQEASVSYGIIKSCDNTNIMYLCSTEEGSSGSPILRIDTNQVIGVHKSYSYSMNFNIGSLLRQSINEYLSNKNIIINSITQNEASNANDYNENKNKRLPIELGLININNNTSYLNSVLQLFKNFNNFSNYYLDYKNSEFINNNIGKFPLSYVTHRLFTHFYPLEGIKEEIYNPSPFLRVVNTNDNNYTRIYENNPTNLIKLILDKLDYESKQSNCNNKKEIEKEDEEDEEYEEDKENLVNYKNLKILENAGNNNSIISNNLNWYEIQDFQCSTCQTIWYKFLFNKTFKLNILEAYNNKRNSNNFITIYDCLNYFEKTPKYENMKCIKCKKNSNIIIYSKINCFSKNIIFLLDRGIFEQDLIKIPFKINKVIKMDKYIENANRKYFELTGIVSINLDENKFISFCESELKKEWYLYNDKKVSKIDINEIIDKHNEYNKLIPCILVYKNNK